MADFKRLSEFASGIVWGAVIAVTASLVLVYAMNMTGIAVLSFPAFPALTGLLNDAWANLRLSGLFFGLVLVAYGVMLLRLKRLCRAEDGAVAEVMRAEQLVSLCIVLFFGIGVIWTAIGMRSALLYALGDPGDSAREGAFAILQRMVDGGILLALSTTIVGGVGGYLMRLFKLLYIGNELHGFYERRMNQRQDNLFYTLRSMEHHLENLVELNSGR